MHRIFITNLLYMHKEEDRERIRKILEGEISLSRHFVALEKGSAWADTLNPGDEVQVEFGYGDRVPAMSTTTKVLATEKRRVEDLTEEHARLNLGPTNLTTIVEKQFGHSGGFRVDFASVLHLERKGGWKHRRQGATPVPAAESYEAAAMAVEPVRLADGPAKELLAFPDPTMA